MKPRQNSLGDSGFPQYWKVTRREAFLEKMDRVVPWSKLEALIRPIYPSADGRGRPPIGLDRMLRLYFLQQWFNLSDPAVEEALYDSQAMRRFVGIDLGRERAPDETTICKFRQRLTEAEVGKDILATVNAHLAEHGYRVERGTIVDATIIEAPSSTKNDANARDPEMHQTRKGQQWYFGMKGHIGVDSATKIIHSAEVTAANVADCTMLPQLLHGEETKVWGDAGYQGQTDAIKEAAPRAKDMTNRRTRWKGSVNKTQRRKNRTKSKVRARVEHPFLVIKQIFGFRKVRYRGLAKNGQRFFTLCALANLYLFRHKL